MSLEAPSAGEASVATPEPPLLHQDLCLQQMRYLRSFPGSPVLTFTRSWAFSLTCVPKCPRPQGKELVSSSEADSVPLSLLGHLSQILQKSPI